MIRDIKLTLKNKKDFIDKPQHIKQPVLFEGEYKLGVNLEELLNCSKSDGKNRKVAVEYAVYSLTLKVFQKLTSPNSTTVIPL